MIRAIFTLTLAHSAAAATIKNKAAATVQNKGVLTDALRSHLRASSKPAQEEEELPKVSLVADASDVSEAKEVSEDSVHAQAGAALEALLDVATDSLSEAYYMGLASPLSQQGYEQSLGNPAMTAFVTKYMESKDLTYTDSDALQGFVMYYDGSCHKKSFSDLVSELAGPFVGSCHGSWISSSASMLQYGRTVSNKEFKAMLQKEGIMMRAAAYSSAGNVEGADSLKKLRNFIHGYINELNGNVLSELKLEAFIATFISRYSDAEDALEKLTDALMAESERKGGCVQMPRLASRTVKLLREKPKVVEAEGIGMTASLDESGYTEVANEADNDQMVNFIQRTASSMGLRILNRKQASVEAFAKWYDSSCATQSFAALQSELTSEILRPTICGGGWVAPDEKDEKDEKEPETSDVFASKRRLASESEE